MVYSGNSMSTQFYKRSATHHRAEGGGARIQNEKELNYYDDDHLCQLTLVQYVNMPGCYAYFEELPGCYFIDLTFDAAAQLLPEPMHDLPMFRTANIPPNVPGPGA